MRFLAAGVLVVLAGACAQDGGKAAREAVKLETEKDRLSYTLGADLGRRALNQMTQMGLEVDADIVSKAVYDALSGGEMQMTNEQMQSTINGYSKQIAERSGIQNPRLQAGAQQNQAAQENLQAGRAFLAENATKPGVRTTASGLQYRVVREGSGASPTAEDSVTVNYAGRLIDGTEFDSSYKRGQPVTFALNGVIKGWTEGLQLMKVGAEYELFVPADLAYGPGRPGIPPNSVLIFKVELLKVQ